MNDLQEFFKGKKVLITGHTGFKGSWLTKILLVWKADIVGLSLKPNTVPNLFGLLKLKDKVKNYFIDIRNLENVRKIIDKENPEIIFHLAAQPLVRDSYDDPIYTFETNILGTTYILQSVKENKNVKSVVLITTDKVYKESGDKDMEEGNQIEGHDPYSASKAACEMIITSYLKSFFNIDNYGKGHHTLIASARAGNVIGGGDWSKDRIVPDIIRSIFEENKSIIIRNPGFIRPWQHVLEPLSGYLLLAKGLYNGRKELSGAWNFGPNEESYLTVRALVEDAIKILNKGSYVIRNNNNKHESSSIRLNTDKAKDILGWNSSLGIQKALNLTFSWYDYFYNHKNMTDVTEKQIKLFFNKNEL